MFPRRQEENERWQIEHTVYVTLVNSRSIMEYTVKWTNNGLMVPYKYVCTEWKEHGGVLGSKGGTI